MKQTNKQKVKTKLSTICARVFAFAAKLVSVFSKSPRATKIPIRQQQTHTHHCTCPVYVCLQNFHIHTSIQFFFCYISPRNPKQSEIFLLEMYTIVHNDNNNCALFHAIALRRKLLTLNTILQLLLAGFKGVFEINFYAQT